MPPNTDEQQSGNPPPAENTSGANGAGSGSDTGNAGDQSQNQRTYSQAEFDSAMAKLRREEERKSAEKKRAAEEAAEAKRLEEQQEFQQLAEKRERRIAELEPQITQLQESLVKRDEIIAGMLNAEIKDWPDSVKKLIPDGDDVLARYEAVERARDLAAELRANATSGTQRNQQQGNGQSANRSDPPPAGSRNGQRNEEAAKSQASLYSRW